MNAGKSIEHCYINVKILIQLIFGSFLECSSWFEQHIAPFDIKFEDTLDVPSEINLRLPCTRIAAPP
jgi:hypothetical protein